MNPVKFKEINCIYAKNQPEYLDLPAHKSKDGIVTSCWQLNLKERIKLLLSGKIFIQIMTFNTPLQPIRINLSRPEL